MFLNSNVPLKKFENTEHISYVNTKNSFVPLSFSANLIFQQKPVRSSQFLTYSIFNRAQTFSAFVLKNTVPFLKKFRFFRHFQDCLSTLTILFNHMKMKRN